MQLRLSMQVTVSLILAFSQFAFARSIPPEVQDVVVIGAGAAGLLAADHLRKAGLSFTVLESDVRSGGRIYSRPDMDTRLGLILDEGANLINSTDKTALRLLDKFSIPYVRRVRRHSESMHYFSMGAYRSQEEMDARLFAGNRWPLRVMADHQHRLLEKDDEALEFEFTRRSIADYLHELGVNPELYRLLKSFFWSEYGQRLEDLNTLVLFDYFHVDAKKERFKLIPNVDEAYTVPGGAGQIAVRLEERNHENVRYGRRVSRIEGEDGGIFLVQAKTEHGEETYFARNVIFAAPLHALRKMWVSVPDVSPAAVNEARAVTYARGTKVHLKFNPGFHDLYRFRGILTTDSGEQIWVSSFGQNGAGLVTVLTGPVELSAEALQMKVDAALAILEKVAPGVRALYAGAERSDAPASYSGSMRPGEVADVEFVEGTKHFVIVGEASGGDLRGYLEGALRSAEKRTRKLIRRIGKERVECADFLAETGA